MDEIKVFTKSELEEMVEDIRDGYYTILAYYPYGEYTLSIYQGDTDYLIIDLNSDVGSADSLITTEEFLRLLKVDNGLEKYLNEMLYYDFEENDEGDE